MKKIIALLVAVLMAVGVFGILSGCGTLQEPGRVYYLNCVPEANEAWQKLAAAYADIYGVEVTVRTVTADDCVAALEKELNGENAPTVFQFHDPRDLQTVGSHCLNLAGTAVLGQTITDEFNLTDPDGAVKAIGYSYDAYGIMVNTELLRQAGYEVDGIQDFASLKLAAEDIHSRADELGFDAFAASGLEASSSWRFAGDLAGVALYYEARDLENSQDGAAVTGAYLDNYRKVWDLYVNNSAAETAFLLSTTADMSLEEFAAGEAVFCQYSASVYGDLVGQLYKMDPKQLAMIPIYCGVDGEEEAALGCSVQGYWAVNAGASEADRKATLDFLNWVATSEYGTGVLADQFGGVPFKAAGNAHKGFYADANRLINQEKYAITGYVPENEDWKAVLIGALAAYSANQTDDSWAKVEEAFTKDRTADPAV